MNSSPIPAGFPDPALVINYPTALRLIRYRLQRMAHGQLKPWAVKHRFTYARLVEIKTEDRERFAPLVQRLLTTMGHPVEAMRLISPEQVKRYFFYFSTAEAYALFRQELRTYDLLNARAGE